MTELEQARQEIEAIDREMVQLFERRMQAVGRIGAYKAAHGLPVLDRSREQANLARAAAQLTDPDLEPYLLPWYQTMMDQAKAYQQV